MSEKSSEQDADRAQGAGEDRAPGAGEAGAWRAAADALWDGVAVCRDGCIEWANERLAEWCGGGLEGRAFADLFEEAPPPGGSGPARLRRGGEGRPVELRAAPLPGVPERVLWAVRDVAHVRTLEEEVMRTGRELAARHRELERARARARRESEEREELLLVVAHELRTPATVIQGYNRLLLSGKVGPLTDEQRRFLHESSKSCQRLNAFIANLLEASRQATGDAPLEMREAPLAPTLEGVAAFLKPLLEERDLRAEVEVSPDARLARFDPPRLEQVLTNLVSNAIRFASAGGAVELAARAVERDGRRWVEVSVSDDGPGVAPEDRERIFQPYVRVGDRRGAGGLGLGLAISRRLVEAHGGRLGVGDRPGGGSRFHLTLPAPDAAADAAGEGDR